MSPKNAGRFPFVTFSFPGVLRPWALVLMALGCGGGRSGTATAGSAQHADLRTPDAPGLVVEMRRTGCDGICPHYSLSIHGDGRVVYEGKFHVKVRGRRESHLTPEQLARLRRTLAEQVKTEVIYGERDGYSCPHGGMGLGGVMLLAPEVGVSEPICYVNLLFLGDPPLLGGVDYLIEEIAGSHRWVGCSDRWKGFGGC